MSPAVTAESAIDFARSSCAWLLRDQDSRGRFSVDAVLTVNAIERYVLTAQVFAGNVYAGEGLFKDPPYGFSAAFSKTHFRIFRDPVHGGTGVSDSVGPHSDMFRKIRIDLHEVPCKTVSVDGLISSGGESTSPLAARIEIPPQAGQPPARLEFPVRHVNVDTSRRRFQVETGPVLFLERGEGESLPRICRAFVNFGAPGFAEFLVDGSHERARGNRWSKVVREGCDISLLEIPERGGPDVGTVG